MAITRINHFEAKPESAAELRAFLTSVVGVIQSTAGCRSVRLLEALDAPQRLVIVEVWDSVAAHQAAAGAIPAAQLEKATALVAQWLVDDRAGSSTAGRPSSQRRRRQHRRRQRGGRGGHRRRTPPGAA
jgi:quinol monooxygenase YgiN